MGIGSVVIQNWFVIMLLVKACIKERSLITNVIKPTAFCKSSLTDDIIKTCASGTSLLFRLQGIFEEDEQHPCPPESLAGIGSWMAIGMSLQQLDWLAHWSTVPAVAAPRLMPNITTKRQATIFLVSEFILVMQSLRDS
jgi:hypothetical protein